MHCSLIAYTIISNYHLNKPLTITEERVTNGVEPGGVTGQAHMEEE